MGGILVIGSYNRDTVLRLARFPAPGETLTARGLAWPNSMAARAVTRR